MMQHRGKLQISPVFFIQPLMHKLKAEDTGYNIHTKLISAKHNITKMFDAIFLDNKIMRLNAFH